jgi:Ca-activated chloride channel family protein
MPRDLVFVIDTSGSMHGTSLAQAKRALFTALEGLRPVDRFNIVQFSSTTSALFPASVEASASNLALATRYVAALAANGGTEMLPALEHVLRAPVTETHLRQLVFITDGSVGNEAELIRLIDAELGPARLFTVGIGSAPNGWFMRKAAEAGRGSYTYVSALHEVEEKMQRLVRKLEQPQVTDILVEWPAGNDAAPYPASVPDLYAGEPVMVRARLQAPPRAGDELSVSGQSTSGRWGVQIPLAGSRQHRGIAAIWARGRIEALTDRERAGEDPDAIRRDIVDTALEHHLVSPYTSLVAVDKTPVPDAASPLARERIPNLLPYGQNARAIFGLPATATPLWLHLAAGAVALMLAAVLRRLPGRAAGRARRAPAAP